MPFPPRRLPLVSPHAFLPQHVSADSFSVLTCALGPAPRKSMEGIIMCAEIHVRILGVGLGSARPALPQQSITASCQLLSPKYQSAHCPAPLCCHPRSFTFLPETPCSTVFLPYGISTPALFISFEHADRSCELPPNQKLSSLGVAKRPA